MGFKDLVYKEISPFSFALFLDGKPLEKGGDKYDVATFVFPMPFGYKVEIELLKIAYFSWSRYLYYRADWASKITFLSGEEKPIFDQCINTTNDYLYSLYNFFFTLYGEDIRYARMHNLKDYYFSIDKVGNSNDLCIKCSRLQAKKYSYKSNYNDIGVNILLTDEFDLPYTKISYKNAWKFYQSYHSDVGSSYFHRGYLINSNTDNPYLVTFNNDYERPLCRIYRLFDLVRIFKQGDADFATEYYCSILVFQRYVEYIIANLQRKKIKYNKTTLSQITAGFNRSKSEKERSIYVIKLFSFIITTQTKDIQNGKRQQTKRCTCKHQEPFGFYF